MRILIVKLSSMGDIVHALPTAVALRTALPQAQLAWVVERRWLPLVQSHPHLDQVFTIDSFRWRAAPHRWLHLRDDLARLRAFRADWAIDLQGTLKSALVTRASGAPHRAGYAVAALREPLGAILYTHRVRPRSAHVVDELLDVADVVGPLPRARDFPLPVPAAAADRVNEWLRQRRLEDFVLLSPGGGWASKRWPAAHYERLATLLRARFGIGAVVNAGAAPNGHAEASPLEAFHGDVLELAALARRARLVVGGDTGPLHLAAALGTPVVALFGPTDPARNGPVGTRAIVLRKSGDTTYRRSRRTAPSLLALSPEEVAEACGRLLALP